MTTRMSDLPEELVGENILTRIPITSLRAVRSTCKSWNILTKNWILGKAVTSTHQFLGFMTMNSKVCSLSFHLKQKDDKKYLVDLSINEVDLLNEVEISKVFHCDGLLLCVANDNSKLVVWNPYLCQTRCIGPRTNFHILDRYAFGYDINRNHKILRFVDNYYRLGTEHPFGFEIYELSSNSWRVLNVVTPPEWEVDSYQRGVSVKGNTYFFAHEKKSNIEPDRDGTITEVEDFLLCFDFTRERFGTRLPLPFHSYDDECVTLSCVRDDQLSVLHFWDDDSSNKLSIWVTTTIEPNNASWSKFLKVEMRPFTITGFKLDSHHGGSFFLDEEDKVAVVFDVDGYLPTKTARYHTAFIIGEDGYFKSISLGEAPNLGIQFRSPKTGDTPRIYRPALVSSSSYRPSLVQLNQPLRKRKERHV